MLINAADIDMSNVSDFCNEHDWCFDGCTFYHEPKYIDKSDVFHLRGEKIIAICSMETFETGILDRPHMHIHHIEVNPAMRRLGNGQRAINELQLTYQLPITLTPTTNAIPFYERCGFELAPSDIHRASDDIYIREYIGHYLSHITGKRYQKYSVMQAAEPYLADYDEYTRLMEELGKSGTPYTFHRAACDLNDI